MTYKVRGKEFAHTFGVDHRNFDASNSLGKKLDLIYDPQDPNRAKLASDPSGQGVTGLGFGLLFLSVGIALPIIALRWKPPSPEPDLEEALERARQGE